MLIKKFKIFFLHPMTTIKKIVDRTLWQVCVPYTLNSDKAIHIDLGSGNQPRNPFGAKNLVTSDVIQNFEGVENHNIDLTRPLPFDNQSIDSFSAYDVLEHIPRWERHTSDIRYPFIELMDEISRCLKPGGVFLAVTPAFPSPTAFQDPTHVNIISDVTIHYLAGTNPWARELGYGYSGQFHILCQTWLWGNGPFMENQDLNLINIKTTSKVKFIFLKHFNSSLKLFVNFLFKKPTHLLWVLQKN